MISFFCFGHKNILAKHRNTLEFTKDKDLTLNGDCIVGVNANFDLKEIKKLTGEVTILLETENNKDEFQCTINKEFNDAHEIVIRTTDFLSNRTLGINATKAAKDLNRDLIEELKDESVKLKITIK